LYSISYPEVQHEDFLGAFNANVGREDIFKQTIGNEISHEISNDNGITVVNFATSKSLVVRSIIFPRRNVRMYTWTSYDGKTHNQIYHVSVDKRRHSNVVHVRCFREADCVSECHLVVAEVRLLLSKRAAQKI
jgi:hypothetical protein